MTSSSSHQLSAPFNRILAVDDLLGKVYGNCSSPSDKRAFRHAMATSYRSKAINAQLSQRVFYSCLTGPNRQAEVVLAALAAYPRNARLKALSIGSLLPSVSELFKLLLLSDNASSNRARTTLSSVVKLSIGSYPLLTSFDAKAMALIFPRLRDPDSDSYLSLNFREEARDPFLSMAAKQVTPKSLKWLFGSGSLLPLASMQQLQCLELSFPRQEQLHSLSELLGHLPRLHTLSLLLNDEHSLPGWHIASPTLHKIDLGRVRMNMPELRRADLPALQQVCLRGISLNSKETDCAVALSRAHSLASWLSTCPSLSLSAGEDENDEKVFMFEAYSTWSDVNEPVFHIALAPLKSLLEKVTRLQVSGLGDCKQSMLDSLTDIFSNLVSLYLVETCIEGEVELWALLQRLPRLELLVMDMQNGPPKDLLAALKWAADEGRRFRLEVDVFENHENGDDWYDRMRFLADQVCSEHFKLLGPSVELVVERG